jgi:DNA polymerase III epsilon subunit-like protein
MKFIKDLLFFEVQTTGPDPEKDTVLQIAAVLLDKDNLLEKGGLNAYVRGSFLDTILKEHAKMVEVDPAVLRNAPKIGEAVKKFHSLFGNDVLLATQNLPNLFFLKSAFKKAGVPFEYYSHMVDLWTLGYVYTLSYGLKKMPTFNTLVDFFNLKQERPYDAFERVKLEAEIFRKIIKGT